MIWMSRCPKTSRSGTIRRPMRPDERPIGRKWLHAIRCSASANSEKHHAVLLAQAKPAHTVARETSLHLLDHGLEVLEQPVVGLRMLDGAAAEQRAQARAQP